MALRCALLADMLSAGSVEWLRLNGSLIARPGRCPCAGVRAGEELAAGGERQIPGFRQCAAAHTGGGCRGRGGRHHQGPQTVCICEWSASRLHADQACGGHAAAAADGLTLLHMPRCQMRAAASRGQACRGSGHTSVSWHPACNAPLWFALACSCLCQPIRHWARLTWCSALVACRQHSLIAALRNGHDWVGTFCAPQAFQSACNQRCHVLLHPHSPPVKPVVLQGVRRPGCAGRIWVWPAHQPVVCSLLWWRPAGLHLRACVQSIVGVQTVRVFCPCLCSVLSAFFPICR